MPLNPGNIASGVFTADGVHPSATLPATTAVLVNAILAKIGAAVDHQMGVGHIFYAGTLA